MWTLTCVALASLMWLMQMTLGTDTDFYGPLKPGWITQVAMGLSVLAAVLILQRLLTYALREWRSDEKNATSDLLQSIIRIAVFIVATLLYLSLGLGLNVSSVLATSAILSVIVGLALQTTLGNFFAGVSIEMDRPLRAGDFVRRDGVEGQVISLNWRSVYLQTDRGSKIIMPNNELNSILLEVISADQPYRHQIEFSMDIELAPGQIIRLMMQVMCSDLPGICTSPSPSVILLASDAATKTMRYAARFYTMQFLNRSSISSNLMERFWYSISREQLRTNPWSPNLQVELSKIRSQQDIDATIAASTKSVSNDSTLLAHRSPESIEMGFAGVESGLTAALLSSAMTLRFGQFERCESNAVALVIQGSLTEERALSPEQEDACFESLMNQLKYPSSIIGSRLMSIAKFQILLREGTLVLGPFAHDLCNRVASLTSDLYLAYRAVAQSIPSLADRAQFLARSPLRQPNSEIGAGKWLGWAYVLNLESSLLKSRAVHECTLLIWSPEVLRSAMCSASAEDLESLASMLQINVSGCEELTVSQLQAWIA